MRATFYSFETVRKALNASQTGLDITAQNIANVNTEGYTRQRVEQKAISAENGVYQYASVSSARVGQGVEVTNISSMRNEMLDLRYRNENSKLEQYTAEGAALGDIENVIDEISQDGLHARLGDFVEKLNELSKNPNSVEFCTIFRASAQKVTEILNQYSLQLNEISVQQQNDLSVAVNDINNIATKIAELNSQIKYEKLQGNPSNELLDSRNLLIDKLSGYAGITVSNQTDGTITVKIGSGYLIDGSNNLNKMAVSNAGQTDVVWDSTGASADITSGSAKAMLDTLNGKGIFASSAENDFKGIPYYQAALDSFAVSFAANFNTLNADATGAKPLFQGDASGVITAGNIKLSNAWFADAQYVTTTTKVPYEEGNNDNVMRMIDAMQQKNGITSSFKGTYEEFVVSLIGEIGVDKEYCDDMIDTSSSIVESIETQRDSEMGVSLDEEGINMMKYQKSYNAAARMMTVLDEAVDTIINKMGVVGR